jgi:hypothetical protein
MDVMMKLVVLLLGFAAGVSGAIAWMLSEPGPTVAPSDGAGRMSELKVRWQQALRDGQQAGQTTEERLRSELDSYRHGPPSSAVA